MLLSSDLEQFTISQLASHCILTRSINQRFGENNSRRVATLGWFSNPQLKSSGTLKANNVYPSMSSHKPVVTATAPEEEGSDSLKAHAGIYVVSLLFCFGRIKRVICSWHFTQSVLQMERGLI